MDDIRGGASDWWGVVTARIETSKALLFVLTPDSLESPVCSRELAHARELIQKPKAAL